MVNCAAQGAILAVPNSEAENNFLASTMNAANVYRWIGFDHSNLRNGKRFWEDGTDNQQTKNWRSLDTVPDYDLIASGQKVLFMKPDGSWQFEPKHIQYQSVCEKTPGLK